MQSAELDLGYLYLFEIQMAIGELEKLELDTIIKKRAIGILYNLKNAIKKQSRKEWLTCKDTFQKYIVGDGAELIIELLKKYYYIGNCLGIDRLDAEDVNDNR